jgi:hypothetical protein
MVMVVRLHAQVQGDMDRGRVLLFAFRIAARRRTATGKRGPYFDTGTRAVIGLCVRGSCRLPRLMASSGNGKIVRQEQLGAPTRNPPNRRPVAG